MHFLGYLRILGLISGTNCADLLGILYHDFGIHVVESDCVLVGNNSQVKGIIKPVVYLEVVAVVACDTEGQQVFSALQGHFLSKGDVFYCACFYGFQKGFSNMVLVPVISVPFTVLMEKQRLVRADLP